MSLDKIKQKIRDEINNLRAIGYLLDSTDLKIAYECNPELFDKIIAKRDKQLLKHFINMYAYSEVANMSWDKLRQRAAALGVPYYSKMTRTQLVVEVLKREQQRSSGTTGKDEKSLQSGQGEIGLGN